MKQASTYTRVALIRYPESGPNEIVHISHRSACSPGQTLGGHAYHLRTNAELVHYHIDLESIRIDDFIKI